MKEICLIVIGFGAGAWWMKNRRDRADLAKENEALRNRAN